MSLANGVFWFGVVCIGIAYMIYRVIKKNACKSSIAFLFVILVMMLGTSGVDIFFEFIE